MKRFLVLLVLLATGACNGDSQPARTSSPPTSSPVQTAGPLPEAVEQKKRAITRAARSFDYTALHGLLDPKSFHYSFAESGDPVGYWRKLENEGHVPVLGDILPAVLGTRFALREGIYVWPAAYAKDPDEWSERDMAELRSFHGDEDIKSYRQAGGYLGWRTGIRADGTWMFFVAGD